jgi:pimeloyl-ACP methyl ester carboxylesterase
MPVIKVRGHEVHYQEMNEGAPETLLLIHGMLGNLSVWYFRIAPILASRYHVVMYDLKSHGMSEKVLDGYDLDSMSDDLRALMEALRLRRVHVAGYSFGALVGLKAVLRWPELFLKCAIIEGPDPSDAEPLRVMMAYNKAAFDDYIAESGQQLGRRQLERHHRMYAFIFQQTTMQADMQKEKHFFMGDAIGEMRKEVLLVYGKHSECLAAGELLAGRIQGAELVLAEGDHNVPVQAPEAVGELLLKFFIR